MATPLQGRQLVRAQPYGAQKVFVQSVVANTAILEAGFDLAIVLTDRNQFAIPADPSQRPAAVGPYLDATVRADQAGNLDVFIVIDNGGPAFSMLGGALAVVANVPTIISMLRIPARYVVVQYQNTGGVNATADFGCYIRSN